MSDPQEEELYYIDQDTKDKIDKMFSAMFEGNGKPSIMVRLAELEGKVKIFVWVGAGFGILIIGYLFNMLTHQASIIK